MNVILFGATGMVGAGALLECLDDPDVQSIRSIVRRPTGVAHPKLSETIHGDFFDYSAIQSQLAGYDACLFAVGVTSVGMSEADYRHMTYDLTIAAATAVAKANPRLTFCFVSGGGADSSERGRLMWARVKGQTENALFAMPFKGAYAFRPGLIQPERGIRSRTGWYNAFYAAFRPISPLMRRLLPNVVTTTSVLGRALVRVGRDGFSKKILETRDINLVGG